MPDHKSIHEQELDSLLKEMFLEESELPQTDSHAKLVLGQEYAVAIDPAREQELLKRLQSKPKGFGNTGLFIVLGAALISALGLYLVSTTGKDKRTDQYKTDQAAESGQIPYTDKAGTAAVITATNSAKPKAADTFDRPKDMKPVAVKTDSLLASKPAERVARQPEHTVKAAVPVLAEKDKQKYAAIKEQMIVAIVKFNKDLYTKIPAYKTVHAGQPIVLDGFAIRNMSITNLEYKTFLADLLAQNRTADYLLCTVRQDNWAKSGCTTLATTYFQDKSYNDFPVVNISYEAAKLFCKWLEEETSLYIRRINPKLKPLQIRLPYDEEWVFAAREGYAKVAFEKGYNTIYDESVGLVNKSFTNRVELVKKRAERVDTLYGYFATNRYGWEEKDMTNFFATGISYFGQGTADTIYPARMKSLGKFGHVSEMVPQKTNHRLWLSGLTWKNKEEYKQLEQEFKANNSSPFVGFRIVVVNTNAPEYKNPFW